MKDAILKSGSQNIYSWEFQEAAFEAQAPKPEFLSSTAATECGYYSLGQRWEALEHIDAFFTKLNPTWLQAAAGAESARVLAGQPLPEQAAVVDKLCNSVGWKLGNRSYTAYTLTVKAGCNHINSTKATNCRLPASTSAPRVPYTASNKASRVCKRGRKWFQPSSGNEGTGEIVESTCG
jgi:hypothetical protein